MECNDEAVERQKLVSNDGETEIEDDQATNITNVPKSVQTPLSPVLSNKVFSSGDTSRSQNSTTCSVGKSNQDNGSGPQSARLVFVNEKKIQDIKAKNKKVQRELPTTNAVQPPSFSSTANFSFANRPLKHHSFISEVPDVRHMERALLGLLEDFHSGKLRAFGSSQCSGCTMEQMTDIREQQERLAKLHFELGGAGDPLNGTELNAQENMTQLVQKLEQLSVSIEQLHSSNSDL